MISFCSSDPPEVTVDDTTPPAVEYTTRNITCRISGGNPSDPGSYQYEWMYRPTYMNSMKDLVPPSGMCLSLVLKRHLSWAWI